jgi:enterochelin esterase-like enzyme
MGGGGALLYFLKYPQMFRSVLCLAPAFPQGRRATEWAVQHLYEDDLEYAKDFQAWYLLQTAPTMDASREIMLCMGRNDVQGLQDNCRLMYRALSQKGLRVTYQEIDGCGHDLWQLITLNESELVGYYTRHLGDPACQESNP